MNFSSMPPYPKGEPAFVSLLKRHVPFIPHWKNGLTASENELDIRQGVVFSMQFPDPEKLLETTVFDFNRFMKEAGIGTGKVPIMIRQIAGFSFEAYRLTVTADSITLEGSDTEGIRRGIYYLMDLTAASPCLKQGTIKRSPWLKNRISRCFFGPIKRPPFNIDELMNEIDYYPEEYLSQLAREGINGLWLTVEFREICDTTIRKAPPEAAQRIAKLRSTVERCRRYGIKTWVFCIEPVGWSKTNPLPEGCDELLGAVFPIENSGSEPPRGVCPNSPMAQQYLYECTHSLFSAVPHLGGMLTISLGERITSCISCADTQTGEIPCPKRCSLTHSEILAKTLDPMKRGMTDANPDAELIAWLYTPQTSQGGEWYYKLPEALSEDLVLACNFESGVRVSQMRQLHVGGDYWLSAVGPSERFIILAQSAKGHCQMCAKLQVATSHECATVPYIPAPGLLYRKYRSMKNLGVRHALQCWYFGNYPGLMNEAAGKLAFEDFSDTEDDFLLRLAAPSWGCDAPKVVQAWKYFTSGYSNYPLDNQFQYYGPVHDGTVWPLHLRQTRTPLVPTWCPENYPSGDAVSECMSSFRLEEVAELCGKMSSEWRKGMEILHEINNTGHEMEFLLAEALNIMFRSAYNILRFYLIRNRLMDAPPDCAMLLPLLKKIAEEERSNSLQLAEICRKDSRLGYHSEAEVYKFFPEKLEWRAECLKQMLETDYPAAEALVNDGSRLASFIENPEEPAEAGKVYAANGLCWSFDFDAEVIHFHIDLEKIYETREEVLLLFDGRKLERRAIEAFLIPRMNGLTKGIARDCQVFRFDGSLSANPPFDFCPAKQYATDSGWHIDFTLLREELGYESDFHFGIQRDVTDVGSFLSVRKGNLVSGRLGLMRYEPRKLVRVQLIPQ